MEEGQYDGRWWYFKGTRGGLYLYLKGDRTGRFVALAKARDETKVKR